MAENHYKTYLKQLALSINTFWQGYEENSLEILSVAEASLDSSVGKHISKKMYINLEGWLKKWREVILTYNTSPTIIMPNPPQEYLNEIHPYEESPPNTSLSSEIIQATPRINDISIRIEVPRLEDELSEVFSLYNDDKIMDSIKLLEKLKEKYNRDFNDDHVIREIQSDYNDIREVFQSVQDKDGWVSESSGAIKVSYKNVPGTKTYSILTEGEIDVPIFNFITLLYEADLYHTWVPFCKKSNTFAKISRSRKIITQEYHVPLIATRQACIYGYGANLLLSHGVIVIVSRSCDQDTHFKGVKLPDPGKIPRAVVNMMGCIVRPLSYEKIHATMICNFDPVIKLVPYRILNYFSRKLAKGIFKKVVKKAKNFEGSEYQKRMQMPENKEFYDFLGKSQKEYLESFQH